MKRVIQNTSRIFEESINDVFELHKIDKLDVDDVRRSIIIQLRWYGRTGQLTDSGSFSIDNIAEAKTKVDDLYLVKMIALPTKQLSDIIKVHEAGRVQRAPRTMEAILSELARRSLFSDTNESESKNDNGDVDGPKRKSKLNSKKASSKRSKAAKNR